MLAVCASQHVLTQFRRIETFGSCTELNGIVQPKSPSALPKPLKLAAGLLLVAAAVPAVVVIAAPSPAPIPSPAPAPAAASTASAAVAPVLPEAVGGVPGLDWLRVVHLLISQHSGSVRARLGCSVLPKTIMRCCEHNH